MRQSILLHFPVILIPLYNFKFWTLRTPNLGLTNINGKKTNSISLDRQTSVRKSKKKNQKLETSLEYLWRPLKFIIFFSNDKSLQKEQTIKKRGLEMPNLHGTRCQRNPKLMQCKTVECSHEFCYRCLSKWGRVC